MYQITVEASGRRRRRLRRQHRLSPEERYEMARLQREGYSKRQIATSLDRSASTVTRELKRNSSKTKGYAPDYAQQQARARNWRGSKLDRDPALRERVLGLCPPDCGPIGLPNRWRAGLPWKRADRSSLTRPSTASSMPRAIVPRIMPGSGSFPGARPNGAGTGAGEGIPLPIVSANAVLSAPNAPAFSAYRNSFGAGEHPGPASQRG